MFVQDKKTKTTDRAFYFFGLKIIGDFGASIAVPVVIFVLIGQKLDAKFNLSPWLTILGFVLAAVVSAKILYKKSEIYGDVYQKMINDNK